MVRVPSDAPHADLNRGHALGESHRLRQAEKAIQPSTTPPLVSVRRAALDDPLDYRTPVISTNVQVIASDDPQGRIVAPPSDFRASATPSSRPIWLAGEIALIIPKRHIASYFELTDDELRQTHDLLKAQRHEILRADSTVSGFNIGINVGEDAGQTVFHCHFHLIPRRKGDTKNPRGGVRGVIPSKQDYKIG